jgi:membrane-bound inhibitor of C-type lysozyme
MDVTRSFLLGVALANAGAVALAASALAESNSAASYHCKDGTMLKARFLGHNRAVITVGGRRHMLTLAMSASGERYIGDGLTFWIKGYDALFISKRKMIDCVDEEAGASPG